MYSLAVGAVRAGDIVNATGFFGTQHLPRSVGDKMLLNTTPRYSSLLWNVFVKRDELMIVLQNVVDKDRPKNEIWAKVLCARGIGFTLREYLRKEE